MKYCEILCENAGMLPITPNLLRAVRKSFMAIDSSSADRLGRTSVEFGQRIQTVIDRIDAHEPIAATMTVVRAELRPRQTLGQPFQSVGSHWCWNDTAAKPYHADNAYDGLEWEGYQRKDFTTVIIVAEVAFGAIDWPFTLATNLRFPGECEITIKNGAKVRVTEIFYDDVSKSIDRIVPVSGDYHDNSG